MFVFRVLSFVLLLIIGVVLGDLCPNGGEIYTMGISRQGKIDVVNIHNTFRQQIMNGTVPGQPKGKNLKKMIFDVALGESGRVVSSTCKMQHIFAKDKRWQWVGQNVYITWSSSKITTQDWKEVVNSWFSEYVNFEYPDRKTGVTGHYTQVVWATSEFLGCDFVAFYDNTKPSFPYARMYTCNYGPGGNWKGRAPYLLA